MTNRTDTFEPPLQSNQTILFSSQSLVLRRLTTDRSVAIDPQNHVLRYSSISQMHTTNSMSLPTQPLTWQTGKSFPVERQRLQYTVSSPRCRGIHARRWPSFSPAVDRLE